MRCAFELCALIVGLHSRDLQCALSYFYRLFVVHLACRCCVVFVDAIWVRIGFVNNPFIGLLHPGAGRCVRAWNVCGTHPGLLALLCCEFAFRKTYCKFTVLRFLARARELFEIHARASGNYR